MSNEIAKRIAAGFVGFLLGGVLILLTLYIAVGFTLHSGIHWSILLAFPFTCALLSALFPDTFLDALKQALRFLGNLLWWAR